jgi:uncharacterized membrane protein (DUF485 family)
MAAKMTDDQRESGEIQNHNRNEGKKRGEHFLVQSPFYQAYKDQINALKDKTTILIWVLFFGVVLIGTWINLQEGKFPFNVRFFADRAYAQNKWGTPLTAFAIVFGVGLTYLLVRMALLTLMDSSLYEFVLKLFRKQDLIVPIAKIQSSAGDVLLKPDKKSAS